MQYLYIGYNDWLSLKKWGQSVKVRNLPYPFLRGQPLKDQRGVQTCCSCSVRSSSYLSFLPYQIQFMHGHPQDLVLGKIEIRGWRHSFRNVVRLWHVAVNSHIVRCHVTMSYPMNPWVHCRGKNASFVTIFSYFPLGASVEERPVGMQHMNHALVGYFSANVDCLVGAKI